MAEHALWRASSYPEGVMTSIFARQMAARDTLATTQQIAAHESPQTTKLYDRTSDQLTLDEIDKIVF